MMSLPPAIAPKVARLIPMLSSTHDGEVANTARAIGTVLRQGGADWHALAAAVTAQPKTVERIVYREKPVARTTHPDTWAEAARWCSSRSSKLSATEANFVSDMAAKLWGDDEPTERQGAWLKSIYAKLRRMEPSS